MFILPNTPLPTFAEANKLMARQELIKNHSYTREAANLVKDPIKELQMYSDLEKAKAKLKR